MKRISESLPAEVEIAPNEQGWHVIYSQSVELFRFVDPEWKNRGIGDFKILRNSVTSSVRLTMRPCQVYDLRLNHDLTSDMLFTELDDRSFQWQASDFAEGEAESALFCIRVCSREVATELLNAIHDAQKRVASMPRKTDSEQGRKSEMNTLGSASTRGFAVTSETSPNSTRVFSPAPESCPDVDKSRCVVSTTLADVMAAITKSLESLAQATASHAEAAVLTYTEMAMKIEQLSRQLARLQDKVNSFNFPTNDTDQSSNNCHQHENGRLLIPSGVVSPRFNLTETQHLPAADSHGPTSRTTTLARNVFPETPYNYAAQFEPVISQLRPAEIEIGDDILKFCESATLYAYDFYTNGWRERGAMFMLILRNQTAGNYRVSMLSKADMKIRTDIQILPGFELISVTQPTVYLWGTPIETHGELKFELFRICFETQEHAAEFKKKFDEGNTAAMAMAPMT